MAHPDSSSIFTRPIPALLHRCGETTNTNPNRKSEFSLSFHCFPVIFFVHFNSVNSWLVSLRKRILLILRDTSTVLSVFQSQFRLSIITNCREFVICNNSVNLILNLFILNHRRFRPHFWESIFTRC